MTVAVEPDPREGRSVLQPEATVVTTAESVALLQGAAAQMLVNQVLMGSTMDVFPDPTNRGINEDGLKQAAASGFAATCANAVVQPDDSCAETKVAPVPKAAKIKRQDIMVV
jgi:hypothetical protein